MYPEANIGPQVTEDNPFGLTMETEGQTLE